MTPRPSTCVGCPLHETSIAGFCPDKIPVKSKYLFLAEAPGATEIAKSEPMVGKAGFVLHNWLLKSVEVLKLAQERKEIGFANVLRCLPNEVQGRPYPRGKDQELAEQHCRQYDNWPSTIHTVILFGEHSQRLIFGEELADEDRVDRQLGHDLKGVMGRIGRVYEKDGKRWVFAPHPAYILRQPALVQHGQRAMQIAVNTETEVVVSYVAWNNAIKEM